MAIETITEIEEFGFKTTLYEAKPRFKNTLITGFTWYYDRDVVKIDRSVYNTFMLLGDVGGLFGLFVSISSSLLSILNYQKADNILVSILYQTEKASGPE